MAPSAFAILRFVRSAVAASSSQRCYTSSPLSLHLSLSLSLSLSSHPSALAVPSATQSSASFVAVAATLSSKRTCESPNRELQREKERVDEFVTRPRREASRNECGSACGFVPVKKPRIASLTRSLPRGIYVYVLCLPATHSIFTKHGSERFDECEKNVRRLSV